MTLNHSDGVLWIFAQLQATTERLVVNAVRLGQFLGCEGYSIHQVLGSASTSVQGLRAFVSPSAIAWFVMPERVNAIKGVALWRHAHICQKVSEVAPPSITHRDAERAVGVVPSVGGIVTSRLRIFPGGPRLRPAHPVDGGAFSDDIWCSTTTTARSSVYQRTGLNDSLCAAVATAEPVSADRVEAVVQDPFYYEPLTKFVSSQISSRSSVHEPFYY